MFLWLRIVHTDAYNTGYETVGVCCFYCIFCIFPVTSVQLDFAVLFILAFTLVCCEQTKKMDVYVESKVFDDELISKQPAFAVIRDMLFTFNEG